MQAALRLKIKKIKLIPIIKLLLQYLKTFSVVILRVLPVITIKLKRSTLSLAQGLLPNYVCTRSWLINNQSVRIQKNQRNPNPKNQTVSKIRLKTEPKNPISINFYFLKNRIRSLESPFWNRPYEYYRRPIMKTK